MWYLLENNKIVSISETKRKGFEYTDEDIVCKYDGSELLFESQTKTPEYITEEKEFIKLNTIKINIDELKLNLANTDYKAIKYAEGLISEEEYTSIKTQRQFWRDEINRLEAQL